MSNAYRDENSVATLIASSNVDGFTPVRVYADPVTHRLLVDLGGGATGITSINADTTAAQLLVVGTAGTDFAIVDNGTGTHTFNLPTASHTARGALSSADWDTFNGKQAAGSYITALTGDVTASGPGSAAATLATVNSNVGSFTYASITVNGKGLITAAASGTAPTGTVTTLSVVSANGFAGTVATATTTPAITLSTTITGILKGNGTAISAASDGSDYLSSTTGVTVSQNPGQTVGTTTNRMTKLWATDLTVTNTITGSITGNAATVTTNANLTGAVTSTGNATSLGSFSSANLASALTDETGTGKAVFASKPTFIGTIQTITAMGAQAIDGSLGNVFTRTLAASETFTQSNFSTGQCFMVIVTNAAGGGDTVTWFSGVTWVTSGGTAPVQAAGANGITTYGFVCTGSNTFLGYLVGTQ